MIQIEALTKKYANHLAVDNISFRIAEGEIVGFLGPNGAGKSTTIKAMTGILAPSIGRVLINKIDVFVDPICAKKNIGYLPERPPLYLDMKVINYLMFAGSLKGLAKADLLHTVKMAIKNMNLSEVSDRLIGHLSKGFQQRVGLAQALLGDPKVLILDEPTVGLDPKQRLEMKQLLKGLSKQHTLFMSSHLLSEVEDLCDRVLIIKKGKLVGDNLLHGSNSNVRRGSYIHLSIRKEITPQIISHLKGLKGVNSVSLVANGSLLIGVSGENADIDIIAKYVMDSDWGLLGIKQDDPGLETMFMDAIGESEYLSEVSVSNSAEGRA